MLGRPWAIEGIVKRGEKRGRKIGFPTCNLELQDYVIPKVGVYASKIILNKNIMDECTCGQSSNLTGLCDGYGDNICKD